MKKTRIIIFSMLSFLLLIPIAVGAYSVKTDDSTYVSKDEVIEGNLYTAGSIVSIDGTVTGDLICAGKTININGIVQGDVICAGEMITVNGTVGGSVRVAGKSMNINASVGRGVMAFGEGVSIGPDATIAKDVLLAGMNMDVKGKIGGDLHGGAANLILSGEVSGDVKMALEDINVSKDAIINNDLIYTGGSVGTISNEAVIRGNTEHKFPIIYKRNISSIVLDNVYSIFAALVLGLVLISLWKKTTINITDRMEKKIWLSIGLGVAVLFLTPIIAILLAITVIGIPLAVILMLLWVVDLFLSIVFSGIMLGRILLKKYMPKKKDSLIWTMIIGVTIIKLLGLIPVVGWVFCLFAVLLGLGGIFLHIKENR